MNIRDQHRGHPHWLSLDLFGADDGFGTLVYTGAHYSNFITKFMNEDLH